MSKKSLTYKDLKTIEKILSEYRETADDETKKQIEEIIEKLDDVESDRKPHIEGVKSVQGA